MMQSNNIEDLTKFCAHCKQDKHIIHFTSKNNKTQTYCKECHCEKKIQKLNETKMKCVEYKGGKCEICGYNKYIGALEFHHKDPTQKDFGIAAATLVTFNDLLKKELDKCVMLCANCHREEHDRLNGVDI